MQGAHDPIDVMTAKIIAELNEQRAWEARPEVAAINEHLARLNAPVVHVEPMVAVDLAGTLAGDDVTGVRVEVPLADLVPDIRELVDELTGATDADARGRWRSGSGEVMETLHTLATRLQEHVGRLEGAQMSPGVSQAGDGRGASSYLHIREWLDVLAGQAPIPWLVGPPRRRAKLNDLRDAIIKELYAWVPPTAGPTAKGRRAWGLPCAREDVRAVLTAVRAVLVAARAAGVEVPDAWGAGKVLRVQKTALRGDGGPGPAAVALAIVAAHLGLHPKALAAKLARPRRRETPRRRAPSTSDRKNG
jgi:hypothetical protein